MKTKHTQGKWKIQGGDIITIEHGRISTTICKTNIGMLNSFDDGLRAEANAKLIAAAPELLQELRQVFDRLVSFREECLSEDDTQAREIIIDIETSILEHLHNHGYTNNANAAK